MTSNLSHMIRFKVLERHLNLSINNFMCKGLLTNAFVQVDKFHKKHKNQETLQGILYFPKQNFLH